MGTRAQAAIRAYDSVARILLGVIVGFILLNLVAHIGLVLLRTVSPRSNVVEERHGFAVADLYPGLSAEDVHRLLDETWMRRKIFEPYTMFREGSFHGRFVNVDAAGFRMSKNQGPWPPSAENFNVFLFGGSTAFSYGLPDDQTLSSYLQSAMPERQGRAVRVYNFGVGAYQSTQEKILFQELLGRGFKPDLAMFIDGLNEFSFPTEPQGSLELRRLLEDTPVRRLVWLSRAIAERLPIVRLAGEISARRIAVVPDRAVLVLADDESDMIESTIQRAIERYLVNKRQIESIARDQGIEVVFVWQPVPYYNYDRTFHPFKSQVERWVRAGYHRFSRVPQSAIGPNFIWCADMQKSSTERLYVDSVHYSAKMSATLADRLGDSVQNMAGVQGNVEYGPCE